MTSKLTNREKTGRIGSIIPGDEEEFRDMLEQITLVYSAILRGYCFNKTDEPPKFVYRGVRHEENGNSFLSTSTDIEKATGFCHSRSEENVLYKIQIENIPFISLEEVGENEILFPPALIEETTAFEITEEERERVDSICAKKRIPGIKCKTVTFKPKDLSIDDSSVDLDTLCEKYDSYLESIKKLKKSVPGSPEHQILVEKIETYKKQIHSYLNSKFHEISNSILKSNEYEQSKSEEVQNGKNGLDDCMKDGNMRSTTTQEVSRAIKSAVLEPDKTINSQQQSIEEQL